MSAWCFVCCSCFLLPSRRRCRHPNNQPPPALLPQHNFRVHSHFVAPVEIHEVPPVEPGGVLQQGPAKSAMSSLLRSDCCSRFQSYQQLSIGDVLDAVHPSQAAVIRRQNKQPAAKRRSTESRQVGPNIRVMEGGIKEKNKINK